MLSYSNFGVDPVEVLLVHQAVEELHKRYPHMVVDGEMQVNYALIKS